MGPRMKALDVMQRRYRRRRGDEGSDADLTIRIGQPANDNGRPEEEDDEDEEE